MFISFCNNIYLKCFNGFFSSKRQYYCTQFRIFNYILLYLYFNYLYIHSYYILFTFIFLPLIITVNQLDTLYLTFSDIKHKTLGGDKLISIILHILYKLWIQFINKKSNNSFDDSHRKKIITTGKLQIQNSSLTLESNDLITAKKEESTEL